MTGFNNNNKNLTIVEQLNTPKTYEQFVLEQNLTDQQDLYPDLVHEDVSSSRGYGPMGDSAPKRGYYFRLSLLTGWNYYSFDLPDRFMSPEERVNIGDKWDEQFPSTPRPAFYHSKCVSLDVGRARQLLQMLESGEAKILYGSDVCPTAINSAKSILRDALRRHDEEWEVSEVRDVM